MIAELIKRTKPQRIMKPTPLKVLTVDDSPAIYQHLEYLLESLNFVNWVGHAFKLSCAKAMILKFEPDIILLDIMVDEESGFDLLHYLRTEHPNIKTFMLSNLDDEIYNKKSLKMGAVHFIDKSFEFHKIEELLFTEFDKQAVK